VKESKRSKSPKPVEEVKRANSPKAKKAAPAKKSKLDVKPNYKRKQHNPPLTRPTWEEIHDDMENERAIGCYGNCHGPYHGIAAVRAGVDLKRVHGTRSPSEHYSDKLSEHMEHPKTREQWKKIFTFDPLGMYANIPTMAWTEACITFPELKDTLKPCPDGKVVDGRDMSIRCMKVAMDYVWNLPRFAEAIGQDEKVMRDALYEYTQNENIKDMSRNAYLPPVGGATCYIVGDVRKIHDPSAEVAVRVHDQCTGSDTMGTDICTCRPYLVYSAQAAAECAQRGGVGVIVYYQKEGRSLGEVTKFRVYNARKMQEGGDRPEMYFAQTEQIAGIRDARFQEMMPDALLWLGISRIDWLLSMSAEKYDAITSAGIRVMQRVALPNSWVPKGAGVEITAKVASGYHSDEVDTENIIENLRALPMVRERCREIFSMCQDGKTHGFSLHMDKLDACANYVVKTIKARFPNLKIPPHSRWRHFQESDIKSLQSNWPVDAMEVARRKIDLVTVSVLLDAGAGNAWSYHSHSQGVMKRSEGLAAASLAMFMEGLFSSDVAIPHRVNSHGLESISLVSLAKAFQISSNNQMVGLEGRHGLLLSLANALKASPKYFGSEVHRPGNVVDFVMKSAVNGQVSITVLWEAITVGLENIWPAKGSQRGDVHVYTDMKKLGTPFSDLVPFHKLSQWLAYSMIEPFQELGVVFTDLNLLTGLSEYRNGGLFIDFGVIEPKDPVTLSAGKSFSTGSETIVEWRALTVCLLDEIATLVRKKLKKTEAEMPLASILEGGTWQAGRSIAAEKRPGGGPPIGVHLFGTVF